MYLLKILIFIILTGPFYLRNNFTKTPACDRIPFGYTVHHSDNGLSGGRVLFRFEIDRSEVHIYLLSNQGKQLLPEAAIEVNGLRPGKYAFVITGKDSQTRYCPAFLEIDIE